MPFNSYLFILCLLIIWAGFFLLAKLRWIKVARVWILLCSIALYSVSSPIWTLGFFAIPAHLMLALSIIINYLFALQIKRLSRGGQARQLVLWAGVAANVLLLGSLKHVPAAISPEISVVLPLGLSFWTLQQIGYLADVEEGRMEDLNFFKYCLYMMFFPKLICGPIVNYDELVPQFYRLRNFRFSASNFLLGWLVFVIGLFKKVGIADDLSFWPKAVFDSSQAVNFTEAWVGVLSYALQLYFDFSGYCDMALGAAILLNIQLPLNFDSPYKAPSIIEFWQRWHATFYEFCRDRLFFPLGGDYGKIRGAIVLIITVFIAGLWYGIGIPFFAWTAWNAVLLLVNHLWQLTKIRLPNVLGWALTFPCVLIGWVIIRTPSLAAAQQLLTTMIGQKGVILADTVQPFLSWTSQWGVKFAPPQTFNLPQFTVFGLWLLIGLWAVVLRGPNTYELVQRVRFTWWWALAFGVVGTYSLLKMINLTPMPFIYAQF